MNDNSSQSHSNILSESEIDNHKDMCLTNLKILSKIQPGDKLSYYNGVFSIDAYDYIQGPRRWWFSESRQTTLTNLENFVNTVFKTIDCIYSREFQNIHTSIDNSYYIKFAKNHTNKVFKEENSNLLITFINEITNAINGLEKLKHTYKNDISTISSLEIIIEKLNVRIKKLKCILSIDKPNSKQNISQKTKDLQIITNN